MMKKRDEKKERGGNKATMTEPQEEFIDTANRPSVPERAAKKGVRSKRDHIPPLQ
ncbi:MAG: hypothetical protein JO354_02355, partial [Verrucomicrobia bacterium]|nr:hypothetical protein [Verrucomicrobiota bacterium]